MGYSGGAAFDFFFALVRQRVPYCADILQAELSWLVKGPYLRIGTE